VAVGKPLNLRLFLEGVELPIIAAAVSININAPSVASLQVIPLDEALALKPRTMAHVFFLDVKDRRAVNGDLTNVADLTGQYKLLFAGEVVGTSFVQTPQSRSVVLQCVDFSSYWDQATAMALEFGPNGNAFTNTGNLMAGSVGMFDDIVNQQSQRIVQWLRDKPLTKGLENVSGLAGGIIRMMEAIGGVVPHHKGINDFFTAGELRVRLLNQVTAEENDSTAKNIMAGKVFDEWLQHGLQNVGQLVSFRDMMLLLMRYIYYDFVPNPTAKFDDSTFKVTSNTVANTKNLADTNSGKQVASVLQESLDQVNNAAPDLSEDDTIAITSDILQKMIDLTASLSAVTAAEPTFLSTISKVRNKILQAEVACQSVLRNFDQGLKVIAPPLAAALQVLGTVIVVSKKTVESKTDIQSQHLRTLIFRPDCWFAPPPVCNVIFPEQYSQFSYDRSFLTEVTRVFIRSYSTLIGPDPLLAGDSVLAPHIAGGAAVEALMKTTGLSGARLLLDHELHTGIVPRSEWVTNMTAIGARTNDEDAKTAKGDRLGWVSRIALFHFFKYRYAPRQASLGGKFNPKIVCGFPGVIIKRPYIIPNTFDPTSGLSAAQNVADASDIDVLNTISDNADANGAPQQLLGMISAVQHTINQDGGNTSISMHSVRPHRGVDDDFLDIFLKQKAQTVQRFVKTTITLAQALADDSLMKLLAAVTPQGPASTPPSPISTRSLTTVTAGAPRSIDPRGAPAFVSDITVTTESTDSADSPPPFTVRGAILGTDVSDVLVPFPQGKLGLSGKGRYGGEIVGVEVHEPADTVIQGNFGRIFVSGVTIYEKVDVSVGADVPLEVILRPRWFSSAYSNANIGDKIYKPFFGCGSILDQVRVVGQPGLDLNDAPEDDQVNASADLSPDQVIANLVQTETSRVSLSVEKAVNILGYLYGLVKQQGIDVDEFITQYNDRPIATFEQVLGFNLDYDIVGTKAFPKALDLTVGSFQVGFHSNAVTPKLVKPGNLTGLLDDPTLQLPLINDTGKKETLSGRFDVRQAKLDRVLAYLAAFNTTRGFRG